MLSNYQLSRKRTKEDMYVKKVNRGQKVDMGGGWEKTNCSEIYSTHSLSCKVSDVVVITQFYYIFANKNKKIDLI